MGSVGPEGGAVGDGSPPADCKELEAKNIKKRDKFIKKLERKAAKKKLSIADQEALDKARRGGMTFSSATSTIPGASLVTTQVSSGIANASLSEGAGGSGSQMGGLNARRRAYKKQTAAQKEAGTLCDGSYVHPGGGKGAHAEAKIFNNLTNTVKKAALTGGSVLLNIDWRRNAPGKTVKTSGMPCSSCYKMLCHAATVCKIKITICDKNNKPTELSKEQCADEEGYDNLKTRVDG